MVNLSHETIRGSIAEFVGVILFVFVGCTSGAINTGFSAVAHGLAIALLITAFGNISGGHFNPAVSLGIWMAGEIKAVKVVCYILSQMLGGFIGALLTRAVLTETIYEQISGGVTFPPPNVVWYQALVCEIIITYILVETVLLTAVDLESRSHLASFAIGSAVLVGILAGGSISGGSMNPARSFGPAIAYEMLGSRNLNYWSRHYIYWIGPLLGSAIASFLYRFLWTNITGRNQSTLNVGNQTIKYDSTSQSVRMTSR